MADGWTIASVSAAGASAVLAGYALAETKRRRKQDLFLTLHEKLTHPDLQAGRTLAREEITSVTDVEHMRQWRRDDYHKVVSAIAMFDILGLYVKKRYISKGLVFAEWGWLYAEVWARGKHVIQESLDRTGREPWPHFEELGKKALRKYPVPGDDSPAG